MELEKENNRVGLNVETTSATNDKMRIELERFNQKV
jgi:hypothetical protein